MIFPVTSSGRNWTHPWLFPAVYALFIQKIVFCFDFPEFMWILYQPNASLLAPSSFFSQFILVCLCLLQSLSVERCAIDYKWHFHDFPIWLKLCLNFSVFKLLWVYSLCVDLFSFPFLNVPNICYVYYSFNTWKSILCIYLHYYILTLTNSNLLIFQSEVCVFQMRGL